MKFKEADIISVVLSETRERLKTMEITFPVVFEPHYLLFASSQLEEDDRLLVLTQPFTPTVLENETVEYSKR